MGGYIWSVHEHLWQPQELHHHGDSPWSGRMRAQLTTPVDLTIELALVK